MRKKKKTQPDTKTLQEPQQDSNAASAEAPESSEAQQPPTPDSEIDQLRKELADAKDQLLRARAEQQNISKRTAQEVINLRKYANADLIRNLLGGLDDFERAMQRRDGDDIDTLRKGVQLVYDNLLKVLKDQHVEPIDPVGQPFDPRLHEAMLQQPAPDKDPGTIIQVVQRGYRLHDRVLRPARVIIASQPETNAESEKESETSDRPVSETVQE